MNKRKRFILSLGVLLCCLPAQAQQVMPTDAQILHLLNRASFGPTVGDIDTVRRIGIDVWINQQLHPQNLTSPELDGRLDALPSLKMSLPQLADTYELPKNIKDLSEDEQKDLRKHQNEIVEEAAQAKILRATLSPAQLQEVMVDFWFNHFNIFAEKGMDKWMIGAYERDAIRPYALGKFGDLLNATAHHPAMLFYLDNWLNTDPNSVVAKNRKIGINENYAREIMELHTLGVNGGYSQTDVTTLAHILTGWGISEGKEADQRTHFMFDQRRHDYSNYNWLGYRINGGNESEVETVFYILAHHPSTAHHIAYQLAQYFVADEPPQSLVDKMAASYRDHDGSIAEVLDTMFHAPEFWDTRYAQKKFKPPFRYVVSVLRASHVEPAGDTKILQGAINQMGEPLYRCLTPNGYANTNDQWLNSDALLKRIDFAERYANIVTTDPSPALIQSMGDNWSVDTAKAINNAAPKLRPALLLSSPEFVYY